MIGSEGFMTRRTVPGAGHSDSGFTEPSARMRLRGLWLTGRWGLCAALALGAAVYAAGTEAGGARLATAVALWSGEPPASSDTILSPAQAALELETRHLTQNVRALAQDRDRLLARIESLERGLDDVTGSVVRLTERSPAGPAPIAGSPPPPANSATPPQPVAPGFVLLEPALGIGRAPITPETSDAIWSGVPMPRPAQRERETPLHTASIPPSVPTHAQHTQDETAQPPAAPQAGGAGFGVDLGSASSVEGLRAIWAGARARNPALAALTPAVVSRPSPQRPGGVQLRLVAGPLPTASAAARLCATLTAARVLCQPAPFDGQPLALR